MLSVAFLSVLFSSVASQQCADGSCVGNDETSLLQVSSTDSVCPQGGCASQVQDVTNLLQVQQTLKSGIRRSEAAAYCKGMSLQEAAAHYKDKYYHLKKKCCVEHCALDLYLPCITTCLEELGGASPVKVNVKETVVAVKKHGGGKMQTTPWLTAAIGLLNLNKHVAEEGLWRKAGNKEDIDALVTLWEGGDSSIPERMSADTVAMAVGRMLQKDPLFNDALTKQICKTKISQALGTDALLEHLSILLGGVPGMEMTQSKFDDLKLLLNHWHLLLKNEPTNRMNLNTIIKVVSVLIVPPTAMAQVYDPTLVRGALKSQWVPNFGIMIEKPDEVTLDRDV